MTMTFTHVLVAVDGSDHAARAAELATDIATRYGAEITLLHVMRPRPLTVNVPPELEEYERLEHLNITSASVIRAAGHHILERAALACARAGGKPNEVVRTGDPAKVIAAEADQLGVDLVVMGSRGLSDAKGLLLGSVSHKVMSACDSPVLIIR